MRSLSVRYQFALALVGLTVTAIGTLAVFAYRASGERLTAQAVATARIVADAREQALLRLLERQQDRMRAFLGSLQSLCGERTSNRTVGLESECMHVALNGFRTAERALAVELRYGSRRLASSGPWPKDRVVPPSGQLAAVAAAPSGIGYTMQANQGRLQVRSFYSMATLAGIFIDRSGLKTKGQVILVDPMGRVLVPIASPPLAAVSAGVMSQAVRRCLEGERDEIPVDGEFNTDDTVLTGFQPVSALGGGCVVAALDREEALSSIANLGRLFLLASVAFVIVGAILSLLIARTVTTSIARLAGAARELEAGKFDHAIPIAGPPEVRQLGRAMSGMARAIGDLVQRAHDARVEAETANRTKDDFLATLSHELRTPLTAILGWVTILRQQPRDDARTDHALRVIDRSARSEARLIEDLLDVTRIINGQLRLKLGNVSPIAAVDAALEAVRPAAEMKGISLNKHIEGTIGTLVGDPHRLQQIVWNLLANSVRFTTRGGRVDVTLRQTPRATEITVSDTGIGINPELLPHVFERFRQGESGTMRAHGGLGLGLAIVRHLVELHGGTVRAESPGVDSGSTFVVTLPVVGDKPAILAPAAIPPESVDLQGRCILVVDDDPDAREVVRTMLEMAGASVATTATARETRALIDRLDPDILIADIGMPEEDGYELIRSVRARETASRRLPAIALTAHARSEDVERALESGFEIHVAKPVDASQLLSTIATLLRPAA